MQALGKSMESALKTLFKLKKSGEDSVSTSRINGEAERNVNAATMRALERKELVELFHIHRFNKPFLVGEDDKLEAVEYDQLPHLEDQGKNIAWVPLESYSWRLTAEDLCEAIWDTCPIHGPFPHGTGCPGCG